MAETTDRAPRKAEGEAEERVLGEPRRPTPPAGDSLD
jgi:hypothetical protein